MKIRIGICGYGNLGKGVESEISKNKDMELAAIFTRRNPSTSLKTKSDAPVIHVDRAEDWQNDIDVIILCGGSATDLPEQSPHFARYFNVVDSFDTHALIPEHKERVGKAAAESGHLAIISVGWDPGLFSLQRLYGGAFIPSGAATSFWGYGVSQGHSDAVRRVSGVAAAIQYTVPLEEAVLRTRKGEGGDLSTRDKHRRVCYVVAEDGADKERIADEIKAMPHYFADYDTDVIFVTAEELAKEHKGLPHGGNVICAGTMGEGQQQMLELVLKLDSNPHFTASVLLAYARAAHRLHGEGESGVRTVFDIAPRYLYAGEAKDAVRELL